MTRFSGLEIKPVCTVSDMKPVKIDRVRVECYKTLLGDTVFQVVGQMGMAGEGWPVSGHFSDFESAWAHAQDIKRQIADRRKEEERETEKKRRISPLPQSEYIPVPRDLAAPEGAL